MSSVVANINTTMQSQINEVAEVLTGSLGEGGSRGRTPTAAGGSAGSSPGAQLLARRSDSGRSSFGRWEKEKEKDA
jgi:hypothetical protein